ncbi:CRISPR-associated endonuclease Cas2 [Bifidobacterium moukalabense]|jgi:CRISPR-associated protein Cas2|uniref:CRISPR-associated endonuclease Cas2 n=1 Tax=Bifidobacterium moukalabense TaxID=1333651 RepID=UPI0010F61D79|nr:CRISPR-associated endonuclease Cas2 [Bifidobacterium moukalabense]
MVNQKRGYLVAYDVSDDYRRSHVAKILQHYGERLQYSVFLLQVRPSMMLNVRMKIEKEIDYETDSVVFCSLGTIAQTEEGLDFLGHRGYADLEIPTII